jgi:hypothetical protein
VLRAEPGAPAPGQQLEAYLKELMDSAARRRRETYEQLKKREQLAPYQERMRQYFLEQLDGLPERCPLSARTVGALDGDGFRIEKVMFQSQPQHHVTALL